MPYNIGEHVKIKSFEEMSATESLFGKELDCYWREDMLNPSFHCIDISVSDDIVSFLAMFETAGGKADDN